MNKKKKKTEKVTQEINVPKMKSYDGILIFSDTILEVTAILFLKQNLLSEI
jgi:hypothetical protein